MQAAACKRLRRLSGACICVQEQAKRLPPRWGLFDVLCLLRPIVQSVSIWYNSFAAESTVNPAGVLGSLSMAKLAAYRQKKEWKVYS